MTERMNECAQRDGERQREGETGENTWTAKE